MQFARTQCICTAFQTASENANFFCFTLQKLIRFVTVWNLRELEFEKYNFDSQKNSGSEIRKWNRRTMFGLLYSRFILRDRISILCNFYQNRVRTCFATQFHRDCALSWSKLYWSLTDHQCDPFCFDLPISINMMSHKIVHSFSQNSFIGFFYTIQILSFFWFLISKTCAQNEFKSNRMKNDMKRVASDKVKTIFLVYYEIMFSFHLNTPHELQLIDPYRLYSEQSSQTHSFNENERISKYWLMTKELQRWYCKVQQQQILRQNMKN